MTHDTIGFDPGANGYAGVRISGTRALSDVFTHKTAIACPELFPLFGGSPVNMRAPFCALVEIPDRLWKGTVPDLIRVVRMGQRLIDESWSSDYCDDARAITPHDWKGSISKPTIHRRLLEAVTIEEADLFSAYFSRTSKYVRDYIARACRNPRRAYTAEFTHALDAWAIARFGAGITDNKGVPIK